MPTHVHRSRELTLRAIDAMEDLYMSPDRDSAGSDPACAVPSSAVSGFLQRLVRNDSPREDTARRQLLHLVWEMAVEHGQPLEWWIRPGMESALVIAMVFAAKSLHLDRLIHGCMTDNDFARLTHAMGRLAVAKIEVVEVIETADFQAAIDRTRTNRRKPMVICDFPLSRAEHHALLAAGLTVVHPTIAGSGSRLDGEGSHGPCHV